jgi:hypothetical protein
MRWLHTDDVRDECIDAQAVFDVEHAKSHGTKNDDVIGLDGSIVLSTACRGAVERRVRLRACACVCAMVCDGMPERDVSACEKVWCVFVLRSSEASHGQGQGEVSASELEGQTHGRGHATGRFSCDWRARQERASST